MKVLFDTNVILDLLLDREPFSEAAASLTGYVEAGRLTGYLGATTITTIHYLATQAVGQSRSRRHVAKLLDLFQIATIDASVLRSALDSGFEDYEDAVLHAAAQGVHAECIVTRNVRDFRRASLKVYAPDEFLLALADEDGA